MDEYIITRFTPEMFGYKDRGILKWQGMILADQTDALKRIDSEITEIEGKEEMSEIEISKMLHHAYVTDSPLLIQANIIRNGSYYKDVECQVVGCNGGRIFLRLKDGRKTSCMLDEIRNVELMDTLTWYDKKT